MKNFALQKKHIYCAIVYNWTLPLADLEPFPIKGLLYSIAVTHYWHGCGALRPLNAKQRQCLDGTMKSVFSPKGQYLFYLKNCFVWNFVPCYWFPWFVPSSGRAVLTAVLGWQLRLLVQISAMNGVESWPPNLSRLLLRVHLCQYQCWHKSKMV